MSFEDNKAIVWRFVEEVWNNQHLAVVDELLESEYRRHDPNISMEEDGRSALMQFCKTFAAAFPDRHFIVEQIVAQAEIVVIRWSARGTHKGAFRGIAPTGKQINLTGTSISRLNGRKIAEEWVQWDALGLLRQLGSVQPET